MIKFLMAVAAYVVFNLLRKANVHKIIGYAISGVLAEVIMVFGYFLYESTLLGYGLGAVPSVVSNLIQAGTCLVLGYILIGIFEGARVTVLIRKYI